jgi:hypothetical protein
MPADFVGVTALIAAGSAIGRKRVIQPKCKDDWSEAPNLWGMIVGPPGSLKTPAMLEAMRPLKRLEVEASKANEAAEKAYEAVLEFYKLKKDVAKNNIKKNIEGKCAADLHVEGPEEPRARRFIVNDATYEALGEALVGFQSTHCPAPAGMRALSAATARLSSRAIIRPEPAEGPDPVPELTEGGSIWQPGRASPCLFSGLYRGFMKPIRQASNCSRALELLCQFVEDVGL